MEREQKDMVREAREEGMHASMVECPHVAGMACPKHKWQGAVIKEGSNGV